MTRWLPPGWGRVALPLLMLLLVSASGLTAQSLRLTYPNGGEILHADSNIIITWSETGLGSRDEIEVEYTDDGGAQWRRIDRVDAGAGELAWTVRNRVTSTAKIRVSLKDGGAADESDAFFTIEENPLDRTLMISPNGGERAREGEMMTISWQAPLDAIDVLLELSTDGGTTWSSLGQRSATPSTWNWQVPRLSADTLLNLLAKVSVAEAPDHFDISDAPFSYLPKVTLPPDTGGADPVRLTITAPNGGEKLVADDAAIVTWETDAIDPLEVRVELSTDSGATWGLLGATDVVTGMLEWFVPNEPTKRALVRVVATQGAVGDTSDALFEITATGQGGGDDDGDDDDDDPEDPEVVVLSPNGGEIWTEGEIHQITWSAPVDVLTVGLEISLDDGATWMAIDSASALDGSYSWRVPTVGTEPVTTARVRVYDLVEAKHNDMSDAPFRIEPQPQIASVDAAAERDAALVLLPNPARGQLTLRWRQDRAGLAQVIVYDLMGRILDSRSVRASEGEMTERFDVGTWPTGSVMVTIQTEGRTLRRSAVVLGE